MPSLFKPSTSSTSTTTTSPNALSYHISTSSNPRSLTSDQIAYSTISQTFQTRQQLHQSSSLTTLDLIEQFSSLPIVPLKELRLKAKEFQNLTNWKDLIVERHLEGFCGWCNCSNRPSQDYTTFELENEQDDDHRQDEDQNGRLKNPKFKIRSQGLFVKSRKLTKEERDVKRFCSKRCWSKNQWFVERSLGRDEQDVSFLEEEEEKLEGRRQGIREEVEQMEKANQVEGKTVQLDALVQGLVIHEKEIPTEEEVIAPKRGQEIDFERPRSSTTMTQKPSTTLGRPSSLPPIPSDLRPVIPATRLKSATSTSRSTGAVPAPLPPSGRFEDLSTPLSFTSDPIMIDPTTGQEIEWVGVDEEGEDENIRRMMDEAMLIRRMVEKGEL